MTSPDLLPPFTWRFTGKNRITGKTRDYYFTFVGRSHQQVADYIANHFRNVEPSDIVANPARPEKLLGPPPPEDFEFGHRLAVEKYIREQKQVAERASPRRIMIQPIKLKPLPSR